MVAHSPEDPHRARFRIVGVAWRSDKVLSQGLQHPVGATFLWPGGTPHNIKPVETDYQTMPFNHCKEINMMHIYSCT